MSAVTDAVASAVVDTPRFNPSEYRYRATYEAHGAAAMGYGADEDAARAHLAVVLEFNLEHNGRLV